MGLFRSRESHHPGLPNIMGGVGCLTADEQVCTACCTIRKVKTPGFFKPELKACPHSSENGCDLQNSPELPKVCHDYHCSQEVGRNNNVLRLTVNQALIDGQITSDTADISIEKLPLRDTRRWL